MGQLCMVEFKRLLDKRFAIIILIVSVVSIIVFYQFNNTTVIDNNTYSTKTIYMYYNQMLKDYYNNCATMDKITASFKAKAKVYMILNMAEWKVLKDTDKEVYDAGRYEEKINRYRETAPEIYDYFIELNEEKLLDEYLDNSDEIKAALKLYDQNIEYVNGYYEDLDKYIAQADTMLRSGIYSDKSSFAHINILKSKYDIKKLYNVSVNPDNSAAIEAVTSASSYINILIIIAVMISAFRFFDDRKNGLIYMIYASRHGRIALSVQRIITLAVISILSTLFVYMCVYSVAFYIYGGLGFLGNSLQSWHAYSTISFTHTKAVFVLYMILLSALAFFLTGLLAWIIAGIFSNVSIGMGIVVIGFLTEYILYTKISSKSSFVFLKNINIWSMILPEHTLTNYANVRLCGIITDRIYYIIVICIIGIILFSAIGILESCIIKASRKRSIFDNISARINTIWQKCVAQMPLIIMELYKILWVRKGIVVVLFVIYIVSISGIKRGYIYDENMIIATNYYNEAEGMQLSEELYCIVNKYEEEKEYWDNRLIDISNSFDMDSGEYSKADFDEANKQAALYKTGLDEIHRNINNLEELKKKDINGTVVKPYIVEDMFGKRLYDHESKYALIGVMSLAFLLHGIMSDDKRQNVTALIRSAAYGRGKRILIKACSTCIVVAIVWGIIFIPDIVNVTHMYGVKDYTMLIQDYPMFGAIKIPMSLGQYIAVIMIWKYIIMVAISAIIVLISDIFDYMHSLIISFVLTITHILYIIGFSNLYYVSVVTPLLVSENWNRTGNQFNGVIIAVIGITCGGILFYRNIKENHKRYKEFKIKS